MIKDHSTCKTCAYWLGDPDAMSGMGWCKRYAPRPIWLPKETYQIDGNWFTPKTHAENFCGEWEPV